MILGTTIPMQQRMYVYVYMDIYDVPGKSGMLYLQSMCLANQIVSMGQPGVRKCQLGTQTMFDVDMDKD